MQLIYLAALGLLPASLLAQDSTKINIDDIEVNFMASYYEQDGIHSPVTGGRGTEYLTNAAPSINFHIPVDTVQTWDIDAGVDFYSSASSDNIDNPYLQAGHVSGPSSKDERSYVTVGYKRKASDFTWGLNAGTSLEWDVFSYSGGASVGLESSDHNRSVDLKVNYYLDDWKRIYPVELRNGLQHHLPTDKRHTVNASVVFAGNLSKRISASLAFDVVGQSGLLSTPFHRVYFSGSDEAVVEFLPDNRVKTPIGLRINAHVTDAVILKTFWRHYRDTWGLQANTAEFTLPVKLGHSIRVFPFARFHQQTGADHFAEYQQHDASAAFYTSDFDLSSFSSYKVGGGISWSPLFGLSRFAMGNKTATFKTISVRVAHYNRSDGLSANMVTAGLTFKIKQ